MTDYSKKMNNAGFSLVELIVSVLITGVLMLAVSMFLSSSRSTFQTVNTSATLQEESMTTERVLKEFIMEAQEYDYVPYSASDTTTVIASGKPADLFWVIAKENEGGGDTKVAYIFVLDKTDKELRYYKGTETDIDTTSSRLTSAGKTNVAEKCFGDKSKKYSVVATNVESMKKKSVEKADGTDLVCLEITYEYMGKTYTDNLSAVTRNKVSSSYTPSGSGGVPGGSGGGVPGGSGGGVPADSGG